MTRANAVREAHRLPMLVATILALVTIAVPGLVWAQDVTGTWESRLWDDGDANDERVYLSLKMDRERGNWRSGFDIEVADLSGVSSAQLRGSTSDVAFEIHREAGTIRFDGDIRNGRGTGFFTFTADAGYLSRMAGLGYPDLTRERRFLFMTHDVTTETVAALQSLGYRDLSEGDLAKFAIHGVSPGYIRGMNDLGYRDIDPDDLVKLRIHGVSLEYVRRVRAALDGR